MLWLFRCLEGSAMVWWSITSALDCLIMRRDPAVVVYYPGVGFRLLLATSWHHEMRPLWAVHVVHHQGEPTTCH